MGTDATWLNQHIRDVVDFPQVGVTFKDITPLLADVDAFRFSVDSLADHFAGTEIDRVVGIEARGFILAAPLAYRLGAAFVPVRKAGKLPWTVAREEYALEYGTDRLEIHRDGVFPDQRVLIVDDVLATGGTAAAAVRLVEALGARVIGLAFLLELAFLGGRRLIASTDGDREVISLLTFDK